MGGADKALVFFAGRSLITAVIDRFAPQVSDIAISARGDAGRFAALGLPVIADPFSERQGPLAGVLAAMIWAGGQGASHVACVPVDGPFLPLDLVHKLGCSTEPRLAAAAGRQHPTFGLWPCALAPDLRGFLASGAEPRLRDFAALCGAVWVDFADVRGFDNLNTPEDLVRAEVRR
jgi:molybdopterin-guanine dinucleotide biosynthesis protein A